jgi:hypothetical protein
VIKEVDGAESAPQYQSFESESINDFRRTFEVETVMVASPGVHTYELRVGISARDSATNPATFSLQPSSSLSAETSPFGSTGTKDL